MRGEMRTRNRLLQQWADVALGAKKRFARSLLRQGYRWAVCQHSSSQYTGCNNDPGDAEERQVLAFYRNIGPAYGCLYDDLYALGSYPETNSSGRFSYTLESEMGQRSVSGVIYLVDLSNEDDVGYFYRCLE